jgi:transcriptional regulator
MAKRKRKKGESIFNVMPSTISGPKMEFIIKRHEILNLKKRGYSTKEIAEKLQLPWPEVTKILKEALEYFAKRDLKTAQEERLVINETIDVAVKALLPLIEKGNYKAADSLAKLLNLRAENNGTKITKVDVTATHGFARDPIIQPVDYRAGLEAVSPSSNETEGDIVYDDDDDIMDGDEVVQ